MRNIPGNTFCNRTTKNTKYLNRNIFYTLRNIKILKEEKVLEYIFDTEKGEKTIKFQNAKEADDFLDKHKV